MFSPAWLESFQSGSLVGSRPTPPKSTTSTSSHPEIVAEGVDVSLMMFNPTKESSSDFDFLNLDLSAFAPPTPLSNAFSPTASGSRNHSTTSDGGSLSPFFSSPSSHGGEGAVVSPQFSFHGLDESSFTSNNGVNEAANQTNTTNDATALDPTLTSLLDSLSSYNAQYGTLAFEESQPSPLTAITSGNTQSTSSSNNNYQTSLSTIPERPLKSEPVEQDDHDYDDEDDEYNSLFPPISSSFPTLEKPFGFGTNGLGLNAGKPKGGGGGGGGHTLSSVVVPEGAEREEGDDWRPSPAEYKKLSSKEKRQLRNKISARNFRVRRKEYVTQLEGCISERDRVIGAIRDELGERRKENLELKREVEALKKAFVQQSRAGTDVSSSASAAPAPSTSINPSALFSATPSSILEASNTSSSASTEMSAAAAAFWSQQSAVFGANHNNNQSIHTVTIPDMVFPPFKPSTQLNMNPLLNSPSSYPSSSTSSNQPKGSFASFTESHPFDMRAETIESYRTELWTKLAREAAYQHERSKNPSLSAGLKPLFFQSPAAVVSPFEKGSRSSASSSSFEKTIPAGEKDNEHLVFLASVATSTISNKLSSAFFNAFAASPSTPLTATSGPSNPRVPTFDADKIAAVMSGSATVQVVPNTPKKELSSDEQLERAMKGLDIGRPASSKLEKEMCPTQKLSARWAKCGERTGFGKMFGKLSVCEKPTSA